MCFCKVSGVGNLSLSPSLSCTFIWRGLQNKGACIMFFCSTLPWTFLLAVTLPPISWFKSSFHFRYTTVHQLAHFGSPESMCWIIGMVDAASPNFPSFRIFETIKHTCWFVYIFFVLYIIYIYIQFHLPESGICWINLLEILLFSILCPVAGSTKLTEVGCVAFVLHGPSRC